VDEKEVVVVVVVVGGVSSVMERIRLTVWTGLVGLVAEEEKEEVHSVASWDRG
jgi:hypothetical protein